MNYKMILTLAVICVSLMVSGCHNDQAANNDSQCDSYFYPSIYDAQPSAEFTYYYQSGQLDYNICPADDSDPYSVLPATQSPQDFDYLQGQVYEYEISGVTMCDHDFPDIDTNEDINPEDMLMALYNARYNK